VRYPHKLRDLLRLVAFQIGNLINRSELGTVLGMSKDTVATYIDLLERALSSSDCVGSAATCGRK
jgi:hypothetical protein